MRDPSKNVDVDVVKEGGGVMNKETTNYFYPLTGEVGVGKKDLEEVIVVDGVEGFADIEKGSVEGGVGVPFLILLAEEEEEALLVAVAIRTETTLAVIRGFPFEEVE